MWRQTSVKDKCHSIKGEKNWLISREVMSYDDSDCIGKEVTVDESGQQLDNLHITA